MEIHFNQLDIKIWFISAVLGALHLTLYPGSVVRDPPVNAVISSVGTAWSEADVPNQDVLGSLLVCERAARVSLAAVLPCLAPRTEHAVSDPRPIGGLALLIVHHTNGDLQKDTGGAATLSSGAPAWTISHTSLPSQSVITVDKSLLPVPSCRVRGLGEAGRGEGLEVHLLGQLQYTDVMGVGLGFIELEALVIDELLHINCLLCQAPLVDGFEVVVT